MTFGVPHILPRTSSSSAKSRRQLRQAQLRSASRCESGTGIRETLYLTELVRDLQRPIRDLFHQKSALKKAAGAFSDILVFRQDGKVLVQPVTAVGEDRKQAEDAWEAISEALPAETQELLHRGPGPVPIEQVGWWRYTQGWKLDVDDISYGKKSAGQAPPTGLTTHPARASMRRQPWTNGGPTLGVSHLRLMHAAIASDARALDREGSFGDQLVSWDSTAAQTMRDRPNRWQDDPRRRHRASLTQRPVGRRQPPNVRRAATRLRCFAVPESPAKGVESEMGFYDSFIDWTGETGSSSQLFRSQSPRVEVRGGGRPPRPGMPFDTVEPFDTLTDEFIADPRRRRRGLSPRRRHRGRRPISSDAQVTTLTAIVNNAASKTGRLTKRLAEYIEKLKGTLKRSRTR